MNRQESALLVEARRQQLEYLQGVGVSAPVLADAKASLSEAISQHIARFALKGIERLLK